jgi:tol-pal system protein YbgF
MFRILAVCAISASLVGCAGNDLMLRKQVEMEARLERLLQANAEADAQLAEMQSNIKELQGQVKSFTVALEELKPGYRELRTSVEALQGDGKPVAESKIVMVDKAVAGEENTDQEAYMKAFGLFGANNYPAAVAAFETFIAAHPGSDYAVNAQYWIGECYYTQREYAKAAEAFNTVIQKYPGGKKVPDALLKLGFSHISMNQQDKARAVLESLVEKYPASQAAAKARERLGRN